ncbi:MAG: secondary thiamine-phosphate synthase enzyme YjbQ [Candidatus Aenigmatarchaeota archaeon]
MKVFQEKFEVRSSRRREIIDITDKVERVVEKSKIKNGLCLIFLPHATSAIIFEEDEQGLVEDMEKFLEKNFPRNAGYEHDRIDDNADAHLASGFIGQSRIYPVENGRIVRGTWQRALLIELDGPRNRSVHLTIIGD